MTREEAIKEYIMPALKRTWNDDRCIEIISAIEQDPTCVVLKQIRAEIEGLAIVYDKSPDYKDTRTDAEKAADCWKMYKKLVLGIIDKYREG